MQTIDVGNSSVGVVTWEGDRGRLERFADPRQAARRLRGPARLISVNARRLAGFLDALDDSLAAGIEQLSGAPLSLSDPSLARTAGADRVAAALALLPGPGVAVDAGTAVTVDLVDASGCYRGGFIAPGPAASLAGLALVAPALPRLEGQPVPLSPGCQTGQALAAGGWGLAVGGVDRLVLAAFEHLQAEVRVVATGGWGSAWAEASRLPGIEGDPLLVHRGIRCWGRSAC